MIIRFNILIVLLLIAFPLFSQNGKITVKVIDPSGNPIPKVAVSVDGSKYYQTSKNGTFDFSPSRKLVMPFIVSAQKKGYKIEEFIFLEDTREIEVVMKKLGKEEKKLPIAIAILNAQNEPVPLVEVLIDGATFFSDNKGIIYYDGELTQQSKFQVKGYELVKYDFQKEKNELVISVNKLPDTQDETSAISDLQLPPITDDENKFYQYKEEFSRLSKEIIEERALIEEKNLAIRKEIERITLRLKTEEGLTSDERKELENYLGQLSKLLQENSLAFQKAEEKTKMLLNRLRMIILAKDSIAYITRLEAEKAKTAHEQAEKRFERNLVMFSIATGLLLALAILFYFISVRIKRQKKELERVNADLEVVKNELVRNVVEVKNQKRLIEEQNEQLDAFVYKASHDIKGPLRSVIGLTQTGMKMIKDAEAKEFFEHILKSTQKLDNLLADLLNLTKVQQATVKKTDVTISHTVRESLKSFENWNDYKAMEFKIDVPDGLIFNTDENLFYSIVQNFIENGIKYRDPSREKSYLHITAAKKDGNLVMEFTDNGLGIDPVHQPKIFDMFYKVDQGSVGTGLGLHIVKLNIEKLKGTVKVSSTVNKGSSFTVTLYA